MRNANLIEDRIFYTSTVRGQQHRIQIYNLDKIAVVGDITKSVIEDIFDTFDERCTKAWVQATSVDGATRQLTIERDCKNFTILARMAIDNNGVGAYKVTRVFGNYKTPLTESVDGI